MEVFSGGCSARLDVLRLSTITSTLIDYLTTEELSLLSQIGRRCVIHSFCCSPSPAVVVVVCGPWTSPSALFLLMDPEAFKLVEVVRVGDEGQQRPQVRLLGEEELARAPGPLHIISTYGRGRVGKSTDLNKIVAEILGVEGFAAAFVVGADVDPVTEGIDALILPKADGGSWLLIDTEGAANQEQSEHVKNELLALVYALTPTQVGHLELFFVPQGPRRACGSV
jgi:hypothetical protein